MRVKLLRYAVLTTGLLQLSRAATVMAQTVSAPDPSTVDMCWAQWQALGGPFYDLQRSIDLTRANGGHPAAFGRAGEAMLQQCHATGSASDSSNRDIATFILPATVVTQTNSDYPRPQQDGLRWAGRGLSAAAMAGAAVQWKFLSAMLAPVAAYQQNQAFDIAKVTATGYSQYGSFLEARQIDYPQRFGDKSFWSYSLGQSFIRADVHGVALGLSNENQHWGPAHRNPLLMSESAPGFPHAFVGTSKPIDVGIGSFQVEASWGHLHESDYFDLKASNDRILLAGLVAAFSPGNAGLTLGFARSYQHYLSNGFDLLHQITTPYRHVRSNVADNQVLSGFLHWVLPESGFEAYGEYGRDDHWEDFQDLVQEPDHTRAYTVGFEKVFRSENSPNMLRIDAEATNINRDPTFEGGRGRTSFYTNTSVTQGYTNGGQPLGAPIGPGSDAQFASGDYVTRRYLGGVSVERIRYDDDAYYDRFANLYTNRGHDAEITFGVRGGAIIRNVQVIGEVTKSQRYNRGLINLINGSGPDKSSNVSFTLGASWAPTGRNVP